MLTFKQFIIEETENFSFPGEEKGWMSPSGNAHYFNPEEEHADHIHPDIRQKVHNKVRSQMKRDDYPGHLVSYVDTAMSHGHARFGKFGNSHYIHFDHKSPGGAKAAQYALQAMKPKHGDKIAIEHKNWAGKYSLKASTPTLFQRKSYYTSPSEAAAHIQKFIPATSESVNESNEGWIEKGWMSPEGKAHYFNAYQEHAHNHHPEFLEHARQKLGDHNKLRSVSSALHKGYARFGRYNNEHFVHFDHKSNGGAQAAAHALRALNPPHGARIDIEHKNWDDNTLGIGENHFTSPSEAAAHIQKHIKTAKIKKPLTELQHTISQYKTWGIIHPNTGKIISGHEHPEARYHGHLKRILSQKEPRTPWHNAPEYGVTHFEHGGGPLGGDGYAFVRGITNHNRDKVLKAWPNLPMHSSGHMLINQSNEGPEIKMRNHVKNADFDDREND